MDFALLSLRLVIGIFLVAHGSQKLFGWFGGGGIKGTAGFFEQIGFRPGKPMAIMAGLGEAAGGLLLALGLLTPLASLVVVAVMVNAVVPHWGKGMFVTNGGWELPVTYAAVGAALAFSGPGAVSLDNALGLEFFGTAWGIAAVAAGLLAGGANIAWRQMQLRSDGTVSA